MLGRRAHGGAHPAVHASRQGVPGADMGLDPPCTGLLGCLFVPGLPLGLVCPGYDRIALVAVFLALESGPEKPFDIGVMPAARAGLGLVAQLVIGLLDGA